MRETIIKIEYGSRLYGTDIESSDIDHRTIFIPDAKDIVMQRVNESKTISKEMEIPNLYGSRVIQDQQISLQFYLDSLVKGQTYALELLFAPQSSYVEAGSKSWIWDGIKANKDAFLHKSVSAMIRHARISASTYGFKSERILAIRKTLQFLNSFSYKEKAKRLAHIEPLLDRFVYPGDMYQGDGSDLMIKYTIINGEKHLDVASKKMPMNSKILYVIDILEKKLATYGTRSLNSVENGGTDWKATMHAVRIINQSIELLKTGNITFPRPDAPLLLSIRKGEISLDEVSGIIESKTIELNEAIRKSSLNETPDLEFLEELIYSVYAEKIKESFR